MRWRSISATRAVTDVHLQYLHPLKMVTVVRLRETRITDAGLAHLGKIATLKRLHLERTADNGCRHAALDRPEGT